MTLTKRILIGFLILYLTIVTITVTLSYVSIRKEIYHDILTQYQEYFRLIDTNINDFFQDINADLVTLSENPLVRTRQDTEFTSFLDADEATFQYHYCEGELRIIDLFSKYRKNHPYVNSVYMGRENGSFVRSHPRTSPTQYDPRQRPWYLLALKNPDGVQITQAYSSVTNEDINIGSVLALKDETGSVFGVIGMDVTIIELSDKIENMDLKYNGKIELWDSLGMIIISPEKEKLNLPGSNPSQYEKVAYNSNIVLRKEADGYRIIYPNQLLEGQLIAYIPTKSVNRTIWNTVKSRVAFITLIVFMVAVFTFLLIEFIVLKPIRNMKGALKISASEGIPKLMNIKAAGEINDFQKEYNHLINTLEQEKSELEKIKLLTITSLVSLAQIRDYETGLHIIRTQKYVELLALAYNKINSDIAICENKLSIMVQCAPLHDIGKVAIPDHILLKPGKLTEQEFEIMKLHTVYGKDTIKKGNAGVSDSTFIDTVVNMVYYHHERWDGHGYPEGIKESIIPIEARIMAVADVYDALTTKRVYKEAISHDDAVKIMKAGEGTQFDPEIIKAFFLVEQTFKAISEFYRDE